MVERLDRRSHFDRLRASATSVRAGCLRVAVVDGDDTSGPGTGESPRVGYAIGRRVGTAVRRNRIRRRLRHIVAGLEHRGELPDGWYLVTVRPMSPEPTHAQLERWMGNALGELARRRPDSGAVSSQQAVSP